MEPREQFASNMRKLRTERSLSQEKLGELCKLHRTEISLLERAGRDPRLETIVRVARGLGVSVTELLARVK